MNEKEFKQQAEAGAFAEWAVVHGNYYGTPRSFIDATINSGLHIIMDIDVFGKKQFDRVYPEAVGILILPPSIEELERRLRGRCSDDEETIRTRINNANKEMTFARDEGKYEYTVVNDNLEQAKNEVADLVQSIIGS
jgi:guanylate kinase